MDSNKKTLLTLGLVAVIVIAFAYKTDNESLYKGQLLDPGVASSSDEKSDLTCTIDASKSDTGEVTVDISIINLGPGGVDGSTPFKYAVYINEQEVFSNTDSYSVMEAGDIFQFYYPISKAVYQYEDTGVVKCAVDIDSNVDEVNEDNNTDTGTY